MKRKMPAVFLDRDGTIIQEREYLHDPAKVELIPGAARGLSALQSAGLELFLVTNQSGVGRGYFSMADVDRVHARLMDLLRPAGVRFREVYIAPEAPDQPSAGRKPSPHFLFTARDAYAVDLASSYMIGDKIIDLECGWNAGVRRCLLVQSGYGREQAKAGHPRLSEAVMVDDLGAAADWILQDFGNELPSIG